MCKSKVTLDLCTHIRYTVYMIKRTITSEIYECSREYPVVTLLGPRQSGKTTLVKMSFPDTPYYSLEDPDIRLAAQEDPRGFLATAPQGCILDEIQRLPELLSYIQGIVDATENTGIYVLTGSHQPLLHEAVTQSLAGRTAILNLLPFSINELKNYSSEWSPFELILKGFFPRLHEKKLTTHRFFNAYLQTYVERDVRMMVNLKDLDCFQRFLVLLAGRIGQIVNYTSLSNDVGVSATTIKNWIGTLKNSFVVYELPPFSANLRKRVVKSPKIYFTDVGLASFLLGIKNVEHVRNNPLRGALYENLVIMEILKMYMNKGIRPEIYFYRDSHGNEVDLIIRENMSLTPIEIKSGETFTTDFLKGIKKFKSVVTTQTQPGIILYNGTKRLHIDDISIYNPFTNGFNISIT